MQARFDLLRRDPDGSVIWLETAPDLVRARARFRELPLLTRGEYVLFDHSSQETVEKISSRDPLRSR